jgi:surface-anchored protein
MTISIRSAVLQVLAPALALTVLLLPQAQAASLPVYSEGHLDVIDIGLEDGELEMMIHDEEADEEVDPAGVILFVKGEAQTPVPADARFSFLGTPGRPVWILPQTESPNLLAPGFATEEVDEGQLVRDTLEIRLIKISGGDLVIYTTSALGAPTVLLNSAANNMAFNIQAGMHSHANWAFLSGGRFELTFEATGTLISGRPVSTGHVTYTFDVLVLGSTKVHDEDED